MTAAPTTNGEQAHVEVEADTPNADRSSTEVGWIFVHDYYTFLNKEPARLHCFYNKTSTMDHGVEGTPSKSARGQKEIHAKITELGFEDCKVLVSNVDTQTSLNGGIVIQVLGEMSNKGDAARKFVQTFFLAQQPGGYHVLNDIFRYLKDEDSEYEDQEDQYEDQEPTTSQTSETIVEEVAVAAAVVVEEVPAPTIEAKEAVVEPEPVKKAEPSPTPVVEAGPAPVPDATAAAAPAPVATEEKKEKKADKKEKKVEKKEAEGATPTTPTTPAPTAAAAPAPAAPTPAAAASPSPAPTAPVAAVPAKPTSWAALISSNTPNNAAPKGTSVNMAPPATAPAPVPTPKAQAPAQANKPNGSQRSYNEYYSIFVKNVTDNMSLDQLRDAFSQFGVVKHLDLKKNCAFIDFTTADAVTRALKANTVSVGSEIVLAEERRRGGANGAPNGGRPFVHYHNNANGSNGNGNRFEHGKSGNQGGSIQQQSQQANRGPARGPANNQNNNFRGNAPKPFQQQNSPRPDNKAPVGAVGNASK